MLSQKEKLLLGSTNDCWCFRENGTEGVFVKLQFSEFYKYPYFYITYGPFGRREEVFVSTTESKYLTFTKLTEKSKRLFIESIHPMFDNLVNNEEILSNLFSTKSLPDYSGLEIWN